MTSMLTCLCKNKEWAVVAVEVTVYLFVLALERLYVPTQKMGETLAEHFSFVESVECHTYKHCYN